MSASPTTNAIEVSNLSIAYDNAKALSKISLSIPTGSVVGLLGKNGAGKSTLISAILGLIEPTSGHCTVFGQHSRQLTADTKARLGIVLQNPQFYPWLTCIQMVRYTANFFPKWDDAMAARLLDRWQIPLKQEVSTLSPGQLQQLACVLALSHNPDLYILDEPVASLDPSARRILITELIEAAANQNKTILFSTHIISDVERLATHAIILHQGRVRVDMPLDHLKESVKRVRIHWPAQPHAALETPGLLRIRNAGQTTTALANVPIPELTHSLSSYGVKHIDVEDLPLEEILLEVTND